MSITDELRDWAGQHKGWHLFDMQLNDIADRIDAEHEHQLVEAKAEGIAEGIDADFEAREHHGWVKLPVDADGVPIHIGDKLIDKDDKLSKPAFVKCILYNDEGCAVSDIDPHGCWYEPSLLRRHRPTVGDVLREFICDHEEGVRDEVDLIAEYAAKLRLRGDAE